MAQAELLIERDGAVATLNRPQAMNALSPSPLRDLREVFRALLYLKALGWGLAQKLARIRS